MTSGRTAPDGAQDTTTALDEGARSWLEQQIAAVDAVETTDGPASTPRADGPDPRLLALLELVERRGATDLHLSAGRRPDLRHNGTMQPIADIDPLDRTATDSMLRSVLGRRGTDRLDTTGSADAVLTLDSGARVRVNVYRRDTGLAGALRVLPDTIPSLDRLGLPPPVADLGTAPRGLLLVTGPTGSGKTTTIASMVDSVIGAAPVHVITLEDPIEYRFRERVARVTQRQIGDHAPDFAAALRQALRQDPDVLVIGEMRDRETIATALTAAETGHLVLATLHSRTAEGTISRIVESFEGDRQPMVRAQLATSLVGVVSQQLLPAAGAGERVLAAEVLVATAAVRNLIREDKVHQVGAVLQTGTAHGMQSMDHSLATLVRTGRISRAEAVGRCVDRTGFEELLR